MKIKTNCRMAWKYRARRAKVYLDGNLTVRWNVPKLGRWLQMAMVLLLIDVAIVIHIPSSLRPL